jgi:hypothetical protein
VEDNSGEAAAGSVDGINHTIGSWSRVHAGLPLL